MKEQGSDSKEKQMANVPNAENNCMLVQLIIIIIALIAEALVNWKTDNINQ